MARHDAVWFSPAPIPVETTVRALEKALAPFGSGSPSDPEAITAVGEACALLAHAYLTPTEDHARDVTKALAFANRSLMLSRLQTPPLHSLLMLQRLRLRANALFGNRGYRPARDDLMESLRQLRSVVSEALQHPLDVQRVVLRWATEQWAATTFNLSLCARYLNCPDEALMWIDSARTTLALHGVFAPPDEHRLTEEGYAVLCNDQGRLDPARITRGLALLRRIVSISTTTELYRELESVQRMATGDRFAGGLAMVQAFVERFLVTLATEKIAAALKYPPSPPLRPQPTASAGFFAAIASVFSSKSSGAVASASSSPVADLAPHVATSDLVRRLPHWMVDGDLPVQVVAEGCLHASNELAARVTDGRLTDVTPCFGGHLPTMLQGHANFSPRHAMVTLLDFAMTHRSSAAWRAASHFAEHREELCRTAAFPDVSSTVQAIVNQGGATSAAVAVTTPASPLEGAALDFSNLLHEYTLEEALVLFDFNPLEAQELMLTLGHIAERDELMPSASTWVEAARAQQLPPPRSTPPSVTLSPSQRPADSEDRSLFDSFERMTAEFVPDVSGCERPIMVPSQRNSLHRCLPQELQCCHWRCVFTTREHGMSFNTLLARVNGLERMIIVIKPLGAPEGLVFGVFLSCPLLPDHHHGTKRNAATGGLESFVWTFDAAALTSAAELAATGATTLSHAAVFKWSERNMLVYDTSATHMSFGNGSTGAALYIEAYFRRGATYACDTFNSPPLWVGADAGSFGIAACDVYSIVL